MDSGIEYPYGFLDSCIRFKNACEIMDITMLDHLIMLPDDTFFSLTDNGMI